MNSLIIFSIYLVSNSNEETFQFRLRQYSLIITILQLWMIVEGFIVLARLKRK